MQEVQVCFEDMERVKAFLERMSKIRGEYLLDIGTEQVVVKNIREIMNIPLQQTLRLQVCAEDANFLLEIADYLQTTEAC